MEPTPEKHLKRELFEQSLTYVLGGFGLVAALAWNEAIKGLFEVIFRGQNASLVAKFGYAIVITIVVVLVTVKLRSIVKKEEPPSQNT